MVGSRFTAACCLCACTSARPPHLDGVAEVKLTANLLLLEAPVAFGGRTYKFIVDTGASVTSVTERAATEARRARRSMTFVSPSRGYRQPTR